MTSRLHRLSRAYGAALRRYLDQPDERLLQQAYELGRRASARGLGVLDMARIHQQALAVHLLDTAWIGGMARTLKAAEIFLMEMLSPFEATHRGFREANECLRQLNQALEQRNMQLAATNRDLAVEMAERKRTEQALRDSEQHYRGLFDEARLMQERLRRLSSQILHAQEDERRRISRELHDEISQALTAVNIHLAMLQPNTHADGEDFRKQVADIRKLLEQTMERVRAFARELRPPLLDELGLLPALRSWLKPFAQRTGLRLRFKASAEVEQLGEEQKIVLYRVTQESLTNVAKHARASRVTVSLRKVNRAIQVRIKDNGRAFSVTPQFATNGAKGLGLLGMQERVRLVNGRFAIASVPGRGTTVSVQIPCKAPGLAAALTKSNPS